MMATTANDPAFLPDTAQAQSVRAWLSQRNHDLDRNDGRLT
jgi:hypothetical protein